jgi:hypothetical protein
MKPTPGTERKPDDINKALEKIQAVKEQDLAQFKKIILQNMHQLSESEQMAVRRDLMSEDWTNYAAAAMSPGGLAAGAVGGAGTAAALWAREQAAKVAAEKAATQAATQAAADVLAAEQENARIIAQNNANELAVNQENARITAQNAEAERQWRRQPAAARGARPTPKDLKAVPTPKPLVPVPTIPQVEPSKLTKLQKAGAAVGQHLNPSAAWKLLKKNKGVALIATLGAGLYWLYDKTGLPSPLSMYTGYKGAETGVNSVKDALKDLAKDPKKEALQELTATIIKDIGTMCGPEGGPEGCLTPEEFRKKYEAKYSAETRKAIDVAVLDWCINHPGEPGNNERARQICATYDNQLPGCNL